MPAGWQKAIELRGAATVSPLPSLSHNSQLCSRTTNVQTPFGCACLVNRSSRATTYRFDPEGNLLQVS